MSRSTAAKVGLCLTAIGALLAFTLEKDHSLGPFELDAVGLVLLALGALMLAGALLAMSGAFSGAPAGGTGTGARGATPAENALKTLGSLVGAMAGIFAVVALGVVTLTQLGSSVADENRESMVAITTSAFGVVSAIVGAFLGIKVSSEQGAKIATEAQKDAKEATSALATVEEAAKTLEPEAKHKVREAIQTGKRVATESPRGK